MYLAIVVRPDMARHGAVYAIGDYFSYCRLSYHPAMAGAAGRESEPALNVKPDELQKQTTIYGA
jgi:hypothetical protein